MIIHIETNVTTNFGTLDEAGNVVQKHPVTVQVATLDQSSFDQLLAHLLRVREQLQQTEGK